MGKNLPSSPLVSVNLDKSRWFSVSYVRDATQLHIKASVSLLPGMTTWQCKSDMKSD